MTKKIFFSFKLLLLLFAIDIYSETITDTINSTDNMSIVEDTLKIENEKTDTVATKSVESEITNECFPPCRKGYTCIDGRCVSLCNPPCPPGFWCDSELNDCVPVVIKQNTSEDVYGHNKKNMIKIDGSYKSIKDVKTVGNVFFNLTNVLYGIGTGYSSIVPFIMKEVCKSNYYYEYDYWDDYYNDRYYNFDAIISIAPQTGMFVIAGAFNQGARNMQRRYLRAMGVEPNGGLIAASWILYAASIHTANWNIYSQTNDGSDELRTTSAVVNMFTLLGSYLVSNISYVKNKNDLENAVKNRKKVASGLEENKKSIEIFPYYSYDSKSKINRVGLGLNFK